MFTVKELYEKLGRIMEYDPSAATAPVSSAGGDSALVVYFKEDIDGAIDCVVIDEPYYTDSAVNLIEEILSNTGTGKLTEKQMDYLVSKQMRNKSCFNETKLTEEILNFVESNKEI